MNEWQQMIQDFHKEVVESGPGEFPAIRKPELRMELIREEMQETIDAIKMGDLEGAIDGMCDSIVVILGTAVEFGVDLDPYFKEVHRSNMTKKGGPVREDGKCLKPPTFDPPNLKRILCEQIMTALKPKRQEAAK